MNDTQITQPQLDDEELVARGLISAEPTGRDQMANDLSTMAWGIIAVMFQITAPIGFLIMTVAAGGLRNLHDDMEPVRRRAILLAALSVFTLAASVGVRAWVVSDSTPGTLAILFIAGFLSVAWTILVILLFRRICSIVADLAEKAGEFRVQRTALFRRGFLGFFAVLLVLFSMVSFVRFEGRILGISFGVGLLEFVLWLVALALVWGILRQAEGIVRYSDAFAYLDGEGEGAEPEPEDSLSPGGRYPNHEAPE